MISVATVHALHQTAQLLARPDATALWLMPLHLAAGVLSLIKPRSAMAAVAVLGIAQCAMAFPRTATHQYLGVATSLLLCLLLGDETGLRRAGLALPMIAFAWSGIQKVAHGHWFDGQLLAWVMVTRPDVTLLVAPWVTGLGNLSRDVEGSGPFRLAGVWWLVSNAVWVVELGSPFLALTRHAWWLLLCLTWALQLFAHEWQFGLLLSLLLLCASPPVARRRGLLGLTVALLALAMARLLGVEVSPELVQ